MISHILPDGTEHLMVFATHTLTTSDWNYAQLEKEELTLISVIKKFRKYLFGSHFTLVTDDQPLLAIVGPKKGIPTLAAVRLLIWAVRLSAYHYTLQFKSMPMLMDCPDCF